MWVERGRGRRRVGERGWREEVWRNVGGGVDGKKGGREIGWMGVEEGMDGGKRGRGTQTRKFVLSGLK